MGMFNLKSFGSVCRPDSGWVFDRYGACVLFATAGVMSLANSAFALTVPKPMKG